MKLKTVKNNRVSLHITSVSENEREGEIEDKSMNPTLYCYLRGSIFSLAERNTRANL